MTTLLLGKLVYLAGVAVAQLTLMFTWGALVFGVDLAGHWHGLPRHDARDRGRVLRTLRPPARCGLRSRMQLVALSNLAILLMSALGGSMFPGS